MVRQKNRWILVRFDFEEHLKSESNQPCNAIDKKVIYFALQDLLLEIFGIIIAGVLDELQVCWYNADTRLAIIKTSRDSAEKVRAAMTLLNQLNDEPVVASIVSVNGSARTVQLSCVEFLKKSCLDQEKIHRLEEQIQQIRSVE